MGGRLKSHPTAKAIMAHPLATGPRAEMAEMLAMSSSHSLEDAARLLKAEKDRVENIAAIGM